MRYTFPKALRLIGSKKIWECGAARGLITQRKPSIPCSGWC